MPVSWYSLQIHVGTCEYYAVSLSLIHVFARFHDYTICEAMLNYAVFIGNQRLQSKCIKDVHANDSSTNIIAFYTHTHTKE